MKSGEIVVQSPAKINLCLRVLGLRGDGFHEIESIVARIGLCDSVGVTYRDDSEIRIHCNDPSIPSDHRNLAYQAAVKLAQYAEVHHGADISIQKRIPAGSGLGGGSSNAAATLRALNRLWLTGISTEELVEIGGTIGADVPLFFAQTPVCIIGGRGELVQPFAAISEGESQSPASVALVLPDVALATKDVYAAWDRLHPSGRPASAAIDTGKLQAFGFDLMLRPSRAEALVTNMITQLGNDLEAAACEVSPAFMRILKELRGMHTSVHMTGSGSGVFGLFVFREEAESFAERARAAMGLRAEVTTFEQGGG